MRLTEPRTGPFFALVLTGATLLLCTGCQSGGTTTVAHIPPPSFNGPNVTPPPKPVVRALPKPPVVAQKPRPSGPAEWAPKAAARPWKWIVVHHSASPSGSASVFDKMHRGKGWDELGYHFVIGNGTDSGDGQIEVGPRWPKQKHGAHAKTSDNRYNDFGIGICLVGNFDNDRPTAKQMQSLAKLTAYLMKTYRVSPDRIIGHGDTKATECPGRYMSLAAVRNQAMKLMADAGDAAEPVIRTASAELMRDRN